MLSRKRTLALDEWLKEATAGLCEPAIAEIGQRVRAEVEAEAAAAEGRGLSRDRAEWIAFDTLGQPNAVNYRWLRYHLKPLEYAGLSIRLQCYPPWKYLRWQDMAFIAWAWVMGMWGLATFFNETAPISVNLVWGTLFYALLLLLLISVAGYIINWLAPLAECYLSEVLKKSCKRNLIFMSVLASGALIYAIGLYLVSPMRFFVSLHDFVLIALGITIAFPLEIGYSTNLSRRIAQLEKDGFQYVIPAPLRERGRGALPTEEARLTR